MDMAEKYGVVPKRFTREWWDYFWMYYKWHTIAIAFVIIAVTVTIVQKINAPKYDLTLTYAGTGYISEQSGNELQKALSPLCDDVDGNGKKQLSFLQINLSEDSKDAQYTMAMSMKLQLSLSEDETYIFIMDENQVKTYSGDNEQSGVFAPVKDWLTAEVSDDRLYAANGSDYVAVKLDGNKYLEDAGIDTNGKYLVMRFYPRQDQQKQIKGYKAAVKLANKLLSK